MAGPGGKSSISPTKMDGGGGEVLAMLMREGWGIKFVEGVLTRELEV